MKQEHSEQKAVRSDTDSVSPQVKSIDISDALIKQYHIRTDITNDQLYLYYNGYYNNQYSKKILERALVSYGCSKHATEEHIFEIKRRTQRILPSDDNYVCLNNGLFNLNSYELESFTPTKFVSYRIPVTYQPDINQKPWLEYVNSLFDNGYEVTLQEVAGDMLSNHYYTKKLVYLFGPNDSGKSTYLDIIQKFIGKNNYSNLDLHQLQQRFANARIHNKRVNISSDIPYHIYMKNFGILKNLTGGDTITVEHKHQNPFELQNTAKLIFSGNGVPYINTTHADDAFYRRWQFIEFPNQFEPDDSILSRYTTSDMLSIILNWVIEGYQRLKDQNWVFTNNNSIDEVKLMFDNATFLYDTFIKWLKESCIASEGFEFKENLLENCIKWHREHGYSVYPRTPTQFGKKILNQNVIRVLEYCPILNGKRTMAYRGIELK